MKNVMLWTAIFAVGTAVAVERVTAFGAEFPAEDIVGNSFSAGVSVEVEPKAAQSCAFMALHCASGWFDGMRLELFATMDGFVPAFEIGRPGGAWMLRADRACVPPRTRRHLAATWDGTNATLYVDGEPVARGEFRGAWTPPQSKHHRGRIGCGTATYGLDGAQMAPKDGFLVNRVMSAAELKRLAGPSAPETEGALQEMKQLTYRTSHLEFAPKAERRREIKAEVEARTNRVYGPPPVLAKGNAPREVAGRKFYVAPNGNDAADGSEAHPFATLVRARDAARNERTGKSDPRDVTIFLRGGVYPVTATLELDARDDDTLYVAYPGEKPVLDGGWRVGAFGPVTDPAVLARIPEGARGKVRVADVEGYPHLERTPAYGFGVGEYKGEKPMTELFSDGVRMEPARYPDEGWLDVAGGNTTNCTVRTKGLDVARFRGDDELMLTGYLSALWADVTLPVKAISDEGELTLGPLPHRGCLHRIGKGAKYFLCRALGALDREGEWYFDRKAMKVYAIGAKGEMVLSCFDGPFVSLKGVSRVEFRGIGFRYGRGHAIVSEGLCDATFAELDVRNFGNDAMRIMDAKRVTVRGCTLAGFGHGGIRASGGKRETLESADLVFEGNDVSKVEQLKRTYAPGLLLFGCGARIERNHFHDMRSSAMRLEGNDFLVEGNLIEDVVLESDDQGGIDVYANPTYAMRFIGNTFRNVGRGAELVACGQAGLRLDDAVSNMIIADNLFENCGYVHFGAIQMNGGRNNTVLGNEFRGCRLAVSISNWAQNRWTKYMANPRWRQGLGSALYHERYPGIRDLAAMPLVNRIMGNVLVGEALLAPSCNGHTDFFGNAIVPAKGGDDGARTQIYHIMVPKTLEEAEKLMSAGFAEGGDAVCVDMSRLVAGARTEDGFRRLVKHAAGRPIYFCLYKWDQILKDDDAARMKVLMKAARAGAAIIDVPADLYGAAPRELSRDPAAIERQRATVAELHRLGVTVIVSSHMQVSLKAEEILEHFQRQAERGADIVKIVHKVDTAVELAETERAMRAMRATYPGKWLLLGNGKKGREARLMGCDYGCAIEFAVTDGDTRETFKEQPTIREFRNRLGHR